MISYELALKLKNAGFPKKFHQKDMDTASFCTNCEWTNYNGKGIEDFCYPNLEELIDACGNHLVDLKRIHRAVEIGNPKNEPLIIWRANGNNEPNNYPDWGYSIAGFSPSEAVANLWLEINEK